MFYFSIMTNAAMKKLEAIKISAENLSIDIENSKLTAVIARVFKAPKPKRSQKTINAKQKQAK